MLEDKNDNLPSADGNVENQQTAVSATENEVSTEAATVVLDAEATTEGGLEKIENTDDVIDAITQENAAESEDATLIGRHEIPTEDYDGLSLEELVETLQKLVDNEKVMLVKDHVEELKKSFLFKFNHLVDEKKEEYNATKTEGDDEFAFHFPLKNTFDSLYNQYKDKKNKHFKSIQNDLKGNLENRLAIVEELKNLVQNSASISGSLKQLNDIRERWKNAGPIPKDKYKDRKSTL